MSVSYYDVFDWANILACIGQSSGRNEFDSLAINCATLSRENAAAFTALYREPAESCSDGKIASYAKALKNPDRRAACEMVSLLPVNIGPMAGDTIVAYVAIASRLLRDAATAYPRGTALDFGY